LQPRDRSRKFAEEEQDEGEQSKQGKAHARIFYTGDRSALGEPPPKQISRCCLKYKKQGCKYGDEKSLKLLARSFCRKYLRIRGLEHRGARMAFGELIKFEGLKPFPFLQPHLKPTNGCDQDADADKDQGDQSRQRIGISGHGKTSDAYHQQGRQIHQSIFLNISFHVSLSKRA